MLFSWLTTGAHEQAHYLTARAMGIDGYVTFLTWTGGGFFHYSPGQVVTPFQDAMIGLSGGLFAGGLLFGLWLLALWQSRYTEWELDDMVTLQILYTHQFIYAPFDAWGRSFTAWGSDIGMFVAIVIAVVLFGRRIIKWLKVY